MADKHAVQPYPDLERTLADLAPRIAFPPTPDLTSRIRAEITAQPVPPRRGWQFPALLQPRRLAVAVLAVLILAAGALVASPGLRTTVAEWIGVDGIEIIFVDQTPTPMASPVGTTLLLGESMTLDEAQSRVDYVILIPADLGPPDEIYLRQLDSGPMVSLLYQPRDGLPEAKETGVGALLMQFPASSEAADIAKRVSGGMGFVSEVAIDGAAAYWITGQSELVIDQDPSIGFADSIGRSSANVLIWQHDGMTYRLETNLERAEAIRLAESLQLQP